MNVRALPAATLSDNLQVPPDDSSEAEEEPLQPDDAAVQQQEEGQRPQPLPDSDDIPVRMYSELPPASTLSTLRSGLSGTFGRLALGGWSLSEARLDRPGGDHGSHGSSRPGPLPRGGGISSSGTSGAGTCCGRYSATAAAARPAAAAAAGSRGSLRHRSAASHRRPSCQTCSVCNHVGGDRHVTCNFAEETVGGGPVGPLIDHLPASSSTTDRVYGHSKVAFARIAMSST